MRFTSIVVRIYNNIGIFGIEIQIITIRTNLHIANLKEELLEFWKIFISTWINPLGNTVKLSKKFHNKKVAFKVTLFWILLSKLLNCSHTSLFKPFISAYDVDLKDFIQHVWFSICVGSFTILICVNLLKSYNYGWIIIFFTSCHDDIKYYSRALTTYHLLETIDFLLFFGQLWVTKNNQSHVVRHRVVVIK